MKNTEFEKPNEFHEGDNLNLLSFKVKEDHFKKDGLKLKFNEVNLNLLTDGEYELKIELDSMTKSEAYKESYLIFSMYPKDDDIEFLHPERKKYKFESYSLKIKKNNNGKLVASRKIITKLNYARAITIVVLSYKTKEKSMEIVMSDINLIPKQNGNEL